MAELVDALDSKSDQACLGASSSLVARTNWVRGYGCTRFKKKNKKKMFKLVNNNNNSNEEHVIAWA